MHVACRGPSSNLERHTLSKAHEGSLLQDDGERRLMGCALPGDFELSLIVSVGAQAETGSILNNEVGGSPGREQP